MAVGLVSIAFFFGALILAFGFRINDQVLLRPFRAPAILWWSTSVLLLSSFTLETSRRALKRANVRRFRQQLHATFLFGLTFLAGQAIATVQLLGGGVPIESNPRGSMFYVFMTFHAAHLTGGLCWLYYLTRGSASLAAGTETDLRNQRKVIASAALYWHFMGVLWVVLFSFLLHWSR